MIFFFVNKKNKFNKNSIITPLYIFGNDLFNNGFALHRGARLD